MESDLPEEISAVPDTKPPPPLDSFVAADNEEVGCQVFVPREFMHLSILTFFRFKTIHPRHRPIAAAVIVKKMKMF